MSEHTLGSGPIDPEYLEMMKDLARLIDYGFNGDAKPKKTGFILLVFPFNEGGRCNYLSNADRADVVTMLKEQLSYFEGMSDKHAEGGHA